MKNIAYIAISLAVISLVVAAISRLTFTPLRIGPGIGLESRGILAFSALCLLFAITFILLEILKSKK